MDLGRYALGEWIPIEVACHNATPAEAAPTAAPTYTIYPNGSDTPVTGADTISFEPYEPDKLTGKFATVVQLDTNFSAGLYRVLIEWASGGSNFAVHKRFGVVAGGDVNGSYVRLHYEKFPHAPFVIGQTDDGSLILNRQPYLP